MAVIRPGEVRRNAIRATLREIFRYSRRARAQASAHTGTEVLIRLDDQGTCELWPVTAGSPGTLGLPLTPVVDGHSSGAMWAIRPFT